MLAIINELVKRLIYYGETSTAVFKWFKKMHIRREMYWGGALEGNACLYVAKAAQDLVEFIDERESQLDPDTEDGKDALADCEKARELDRIMEAFDHVTVDCFGIRLRPTYKESIIHFRDLWLRFEPHDRDDIQP